MNVLFVGDLHFKVTNVVESKILIESLKTIIMEKNPNFVVLGGDLLHTHERLHTVPLNLCYKLISWIAERCKVYVIVGNHDFISNQQWLTDHHWMNGMKKWNNVFICDKPFFTKWNDYQFLFVPYVPNGKFLETLKTLNPIYGENYIKNISCIFAHQEFKDCELGHNIVSDMGDDISKETTIRQIVSGHIHKNQTIRNIYYPGSCMQHTFQESEKNIVAMLHFNQNKPMKITEIEIRLPKKITKTITMEEFLQLDPAKIKIHPSDSYRLIIQCEESKSKHIKKTKHYKSFIKNNIKCIFQTLFTTQHKNFTNKSFTFLLQHLIKDNHDLQTIFKSCYNKIQ